MSNGTHRECFRCRDCGSYNLQKIHTFCIDFRTVNFSDDVVYDYVNEEYYKCTECSSIYTRDEILNTLKNMITKYKEDRWGEK